jgi:hypothetical protein
LSRNNPLPICIRLLSHRLTSLWQFCNILLSHFPISSSPIPISPVLPLMVTVIS